jgi:hypothetical protein
MPACIVWLLVSVFYLFSLSTEPKNVKIVPHGLNIRWRQTQNDTRSRLALIFKKISLSLLLSTLRRSAHVGRKWQSQYSQLAYAVREKMGGRKRRKILNKFRITFPICKKPLLFRNSFVIHRFPAFLNANWIVLLEQKLSKSSFHIMNEKCNKKEWASRILRLILAYFSLYKAYVLN